MSRFVVTIDTEEEGLWGGQYRPTGHSVENLRGVPRFQELCDRFGVQPTYLVTAPVANDDFGAGLLADLQADGRCEVGAHLHPWCTPPLTDRPATTAESFLCNLPEPAQRAKLEWLTDTIERRFGRRPTSFRAGRYGLDAVGARILEELGYAVDSSVIPFTNYASQQGPDFREAPFTPYWFDGADLCAPGDAGALLEAPVTVGFSHSRFAFAHRLQETARIRGLRQLRIEGLLDRLGVARRIKFSPEQATSRELVQLADAALRAAERPTALVLMFHSSSLLPGCSPYVRTPVDLDAFCDRLTAVFAHCLNDRGLTAATLSDLPAQQRVWESAVADSTMATSASSPRTEAVR
ncbi:MAG: polysaccharide deacetylase family protein [Planctomyces sp.]|nr:polysaccharide deacetylase family protein [Planctomyces sp.]